MRTGSVVKQRSPFALCMLLILLLRKINCQTYLITYTHTRSHSHLDERPQIHGGRKGTGWELSGKASFLPSEI